MQIAFLDFSLVFSIRWGIAACVLHDIMRNRADSDIFVFLIEHGMHGGDRRSVRNDQHV